jgi:hypothetical protein
MSKNRLQNVLTKEILEYEYKTCGSMQKMADKLQISVDSVYKYMKLYGIQYAPHYQGLYDCNENIFRNETPEAFYLAGFIAADGSLQKRKYSKILKITLAKKDRSHLEKIKILLQSNHPIKEYYVKPSKLIKKTGMCAEIQIVSNNIFDDLSKFNIVPNKTFKYLMPDWLIPHPLINHFMRGYFDGDGTITYCGLGKNRTVKQMLFSVLGTKRFINEYKNILALNANLNDAKIIKQDNVYRISYSGNNIVKRIYDFLYNETTIHLDRKENKFKK